MNKVFRKTKKGFDIYVEYFSSSSIRTISLLLFVNILFLGVNIFLLENSQNFKSRIASQGKAVVQTTPTLYYCGSCTLGSCIPQADATTTLCTWSCVVNGTTVQMPPYTTPISDTTVPSDPTQCHLTTNATYQQCSTCEASNSTTTPPAVDCGTENQQIPFPSPVPAYTKIQCMADNASTCASAKIVLNHSIELSPLADIKISSITNGDISKNTDNSCSLHVKQGALDFLRYGGTNQQKQDALTQLKKREGLEGTCVFQNNADVVNFFNRLKNGTLTFSSNPANMFTNGTCSGAYFDSLSLPVIPTLTPSATPTRTPTPTATPTPNGPAAHLTFDVKVPGIGGNVWGGENNNPIQHARSFQIYLYNASDSMVKQQEVQLTYNGGTYVGTATISGIPMTSYTVRIKSNNSLLRIIPGVIQLAADKTTSTVQVTLVTGNIDDSSGYHNTLDIMDYNALLSCFSTQCTGSPLQQADLNDDGKIDGKDMNILLRGFANRDSN